MSTQSRVRWSLHPRAGDCHRGRGWRIWRASARETKMDCDAAALPGFRRAMRVEPGPDAVLAMLEDDLHCMAVRLRHDGTVVRTVDAYGDRMPWSPCPGAEAKLAQTFAGLPLAEVTARRDKQQNCTHLHDLAVMAAAHAGDTAPVEYRVEVSDPREGMLACTGKGAGKFPGGRGISRPRSHGD